MQVVLPILDSVVEKEGNLKHIQLNKKWLPKKWQSTRSQSLDQFLAKYNDLLRGRTVPCSVWSCDNICTGGMVHRSGERYGIQDMTCYTCTRNFCRVCSFNQSNSFTNALHFCSSCERIYCHRCDPFTGCVAGCSTNKCRSCRSKLWSSQGKEYSCKACNDGPICEKCVIITRCCGSSFCRWECAIPCCDEGYDY